MNAIAAGAIPLRAREPATRRAASSPTRIATLAISLFAGTWPAIPGRAGDDPAARAARLVSAMTLDEKISLVHAGFGMPFQGRPMPDGALGSAGFAPGIPRVGIPPLQEADGGLGVANPTNAPYDATAMPSALALAATFDPDLATRVGAAIGAEARDMGFSVLLAGAANLTRDPRGGRDFEYAGEDPLLTGTMVGAAIAGIQSNRIVSTLKHVALNDQETGRVMLDARLSPAAARESDLLAFELALERGHPGAVMTSYNRIDGSYASQDRHLVTDVLKHDWHFDGWVMSDWGSTHATVEAAQAGLDQESGSELDPGVVFGAALKAAVERGEVPVARLDDMVARQLRARIAAGTFDDPPRAGHARDLDAHADLALEAATRGIVLLKNRANALPLDSHLRRVLVVGGHADIGVLSGGGSSQVVPLGGVRFAGDPPGVFYGKPKLFDPAPPLAALRAALPAAIVTFVDGTDATTAAEGARQADAVVVFATQWRNESRDLADLSLPGGQDDLIAALAAANSRTIVVLETGGPVLMPWLDKVAGVLEAWYPGERGGSAIAAILTGASSPSGRLPMTFPAGIAQLPRPNGLDPAAVTSNPGEPLKGGPIRVDYDIEAADVGYKWFRRTNRKPLFPFGFGLSYAEVVPGAITAVATRGSVTLGFDLRNNTTRAITDVAQAYVEGLGLSRRLAGFAAVPLAGGETRHVSFTVDPRLLARFETGGHGWRIAPGDYRFAIRPSALSDGPSATLSLPERFWPADASPPR